MLVFFYAFLIAFIHADEGCPAGMRKTYADDSTMDQYGTARKSIGAVCFGDQPGSLFFNRKVLIEPRFEIHLKTVYEAIANVDKSGEQKLYGFTMVISGTKNTISSLGGVNVYNGLGVFENTYDNVGYNNFRNALIIEFDFEKDYGDPAPNSVSMRYCGTSCGINEKLAFFSTTLNQQTYTRGKKNNWDFRLVYRDKTLILYVGTSVIRTISYDLEKTLGTNIAYY